MKDIPVIKLFVEHGKYYVYDTCKNQIINITKKQFEEIKCLENCGIERYREMRKDTAEYNDVLLLINKGYFRSNYIHHVCHPSTDYVDLLIRRNVNELVLQVTQDCNFKCRYCLFTRENNIDRCHEKVNMPWEIAKKSLDMLYSHSADANIISISFYGGEPLLNFELIKQVAAYADNIFQSKKIHYSMTINGSLLSQEIIDFLIEHTPKSKISRAIEFSSQVGKQCVVINNPWSDPLVKETKIISTKNKKIEYGKKPVILLMSTGRFAELYYTELILNRILFEENIGFIQELSKSTNHLISQLAQSGVIRESIIQSLSIPYSQASIIIKSILFEELSNESYLESIKPDFIMMTCLADYQCINQMSNFFAYKYGRKIDLISFIPYISVEKYEKSFWPVYCSQLKTVVEYCGVDIYSEHIDRIVKDAVLAKIAIPAGVRII